MLWMDKSFRREKVNDPEPNSVSVVEAANYCIWCSLLNLHNSHLRDGSSREIHIVLAIVQAVKLSPEEARSVADKWKELPALMRELNPPPLFADLIEKILAELASR